MGVVIGINAYQKAADCIVGHVNILGVYEVKEDAIMAYELPDLDICHYGEIYLITEIMNSRRLYQYSLDAPDLYFYNQAPSPYSGAGYGKHEGITTCLMFDPVKLLSTISSLLDAADDILSSLEDSTVALIKERGEVEMLTAFKALLEKAVEKDAIVSFTFG
ncbi:hypothetical protein [Chitinophaga sp. Cy-1792]|uniref:hypothetical protein n=1 Tax=Chitinophaga sp. Cy-1792 TaxID=2608339 RepID=UPI00141F0EDE|nr:hypothetical protein [Chitinophaga sp. Cy-1792]NIG55064.1 hypothetical protein [Chitinophaga sp. Cy-1792]